MKLTKECFALALLLLVAGCGQKISAPATSTAADSVAQPAPPITIDPMVLALMPQEGDTHTDAEIRRYQDLVRQGSNGVNRVISVEKLGWLFVTKARESFDPGYYKQAAACAQILDAGSPGCSQSLLLQGYVFENMHRFKEAEPLARELVNNRGLPFDYGLLGDSLMEQGRLAEAVTNYQSMVNLRPDLQSYSRIAYIRWLTGDLDGAIEMMSMAVNSSSPRDPDSAAWVITRLGILQFQAGKIEEATQSCDAALQVRPNYPPALLLRGRMLMADNQPEAAVENLQIAAKANPLPEYQWALSESLRAADRVPDAEAIESHLRSTGTVNDPRTLSLFLSTQGQDTGTAVRLAEAELQQRGDVFTQDAFAWALAAAGQAGPAQSHMQLALVAGTEDSRLFFHAAVIAHLAGDETASQKWFMRASAALQTLLPSERKQLMKLADDFPDANDTTPATATNDDAPANDLPAPEMAARK